MKKLMNKKIWIPLLIGIVFVAAIVFFIIFRPIAAFDLNLQQEETASFSERSGLEWREEMLCMAENDNGKLWLSTIDGNFYVELQDGTKWWAFPEDAQKDKIARGVYKTELRSALIIEYVNHSASTTVKKNSYATCVQKENFHLYPIKNGFLAEYYFSEPDITIPVEVTLQEDYLNLKVVTAAIEEKNPEKFQLQSIWLCPNFGAAASGEEGYIMVPDGSGALMYFNNNKYSFLDYAAPVYGFDLSILTSFERANGKMAMFPVFGMKKGDQGFLAVITQGAASATLHTLTNMRNSSYSSAYASFLLRTEDKVTFDHEGATSQTVKVYQKGQMEAAACEQRIYFLSGDQADYNGMAARYRQYLVDTYGLQEKENKTEQALKVLVDYHVAVKKNQPILGIPAMRTTVLSSLDEIRAAYEELRENVDGAIAIRLLSWNEDQLSGSPDLGAELISKAGSMAELKELNQVMAAQGDQLSVGVDLVNFEKGGHGINTYRHIAYGLNNSPSYQYRYKLSTRMKDANANNIYMLDARFLRYEADTLLKNMPDQDTLSGLSPYTIGNRKYSSFTKPLISNEQWVQASVLTLGMLGQQYDLVLEEAHDYALPYAGIIADAPTSSSNYDTMDEEIPFYQLVVSGLVDYTTEAINANGYSEDYYLLKAIETGSALHYTLIAREQSLLMETSLNVLYSAQQSVWLPKITEAQAHLELVRQATEGSRLIKHEYLSDDAVLSTFENGVRIAVNYSDETVQTPFGTVEAMSYLIEGGEERP